MALSPQVWAALAKAEEEHNKLDDEFDAVQVPMTAALRAKVEKFFEERKQLIAAIDGFWANALTSEVSDLQDMMNTTLDARAIRAVSDLKIINGTNGDKPSRRVVLTLKPNMFIKNTELWLEMDSDLDVVGASGVSWCDGTERARADSVFQFFDPKAELQGEFERIDVLDAFDGVYTSAGMKL